MRAALALAGGGSLGTFISAACRELLIGIRRHNVAFETGAPDDDPRWLHPRWGRIVVDSVGGASAGALCGSQFVRALFEPSYAGEGLPIDTAGTITGDWIRAGDFQRLAVEGNQALAVGTVEAPGWTLLSGARVHQLALNALTPAGGSPDDVPGSPLDASGVVALGITLTDLLGFHEAADFVADRVLGHPDFGCVESGPSQILRHEGERVRDLGGKGHAEVRRLFLGYTERSRSVASEFLAATRRTTRGGSIRWSSTAADRLASLCAASAALPLAIGPIAVTDPSGDAGNPVRRLYMDGGTLNNKPIAPALKLARWHDMMRLLQRRDPNTGEFRPHDIRELLVYERVCFFVDAFPDRARGAWRSVNPELVSAPGRSEAEDAAVARNARIDAALQTPAAALDVFFESLMTSLRAQDMQGIAKMNHRLMERAQFLSERIGTPPLHPTRFRVDSLARAQAFASVIQSDTQGVLSDEQALRIAERVWESDRYSGLEGRREVTMIPVFSPENLREVLAGDAMYAVGGLLALNARRHDAEVGATVTRHVLSALATPGRTPESVRLPPAPDAALPDDSAPLAARLVVAAKALIDANIRSGVLRFFAKLPLSVDPLVRGLKTRLDRAITGAPDL